ncbi:MAG: response regulator [Anaerolineae bacterium]|nr:response regulator [Anaerolineae bacterium]
MSQTPSHTQRPLRILLLEDVPRDAELIAYEIEQIVQTYQLSVVNNRDDFEEALDKFKPDLILADYKVPLFNGDQSLWLAQSRVPHIPFVFVTGTMEDEELAAHTILNGASGFVLKKNLRRLPQVITQAMANNASIYLKTQTSLHQLQEKVQQQQKEISLYHTKLEEMRLKLQQLQERLKAKNHRK